MVAGILHLGNITISAKVNTVFISLRARFAGSVRTRAHFQHIQKNGEECEITEAESLKKVSGIHTIYMSAQITMLT